MKKKVSIVVLFALIALSVSFLMSGPFSDPIFSYCLDKCKIFLNQPGYWDACFDGCYAGL
jgi:hypothetical protein